LSCSDAFSVSAELCSCSVILVPFLLGVIVDQPHAEGCIISHCAVKVTITQFSVVTHVHSGTTFL
jgi:hypothetical protein